MPIELKIHMDGVDSVNNDIKRIQNELQKMKTNVAQSTEKTSLDIQKTGSGLGSLVSKIAPIAAGIGGAVFAVKEIGGQVANVVNEYTNAYYEANKIAKLWDVSFANNAGAVGMTAKALQQLSDQIQKNSVYDDDILRESQAMLLQYKELGSDVFPRAQQAAANMAVSLQMDLVSASQKVGIALSNPIAGLEKLTKQGIIFSEEEKKQIKIMTESGKIYEAQTIILNKLSEKFAGAAKAVADTPMGQLQIFKNLMDDIKEAIGSLLVTGLEPIIDVIHEIFSEISLTGDTFDFLKKSMRSIGFIIAAVIKSIIANVKILIGIWQSTVDFFIFSVNLIGRSFSTVKTIVSDIVKYISETIKLLVSGNISELIDYVSNELPKIGKKITKTLQDNALANKNELSSVGNSIGNVIDKGIADGMKAQSLIEEAFKFKLVDKNELIKKESTNLGKDIATNVASSISVTLYNLMPKMLSFSDKLKVSMGENFQIDEEEFEENNKNIGILFANLIASTETVASINDRYTEVADSISSAFGSSFSQLITGSINMKNAVTSVLDSIGSAAQNVVNEGISTVVGQLLKKAGAKIVTAIANIYEWFSSLPPPIGIPLALAGGATLTAGFFAARKKLGFAEGGVWRGGPAMIIPTSGRGPIATISEDGRPERITPSTGSSPSTTIVINSDIIDSQGLMTLTDKINLENKKQSKYMRG